MLQGHTPLQVVAAARRPLPPRTCSASPLPCGRPTGEEEQFLRELINPESPDFHHFLTAAEWNARFSPSAADEQKVVNWARSQGLNVTNRYPNRLLVDVEAPSGVIEKALSVTVNSYRSTMNSTTRTTAIRASGQPERHRHRRVRAQQHPADAQHQRGA